MRRASGAVIWFKPTTTTLPAFLFTFAFFFAATRGDNQVPNNIKQAIGNSLEKTSTVSSRTGRYNTVKNAKFHRMWMYDYGAEFDRWVGTCWSIFGLCLQQIFVTRENTHFQQSRRWTGLTSTFVGLGTNYLHTSTSAKPTPTVARCDYLTRFLNVIRPIKRL